MDRPAIRFPAEWEPHSGVQLTWPHAGTDWAPRLEEARACFVAIAKEVASRESLLVVARDKDEVTRCLLDGQVPMGNVQVVEVPTNDTWSRDHGGITVFEDGAPVVLDFAFNGWGSKFGADLDNRITRNLNALGVFLVPVRDRIDFILEGGSVESDGQGTILTTVRCLLSKTRNGSYTRAQIEQRLQRDLGARRVLFLSHGYLEGDDTDSHIDTLARFCDEQTIAYVRCDDPCDVHYTELQAMEAELRSLRTEKGRPYRLVPLPMAEAAFDKDGHRLPATYANFLILNGAVLVPCYGTAKDAAAMEALVPLFPGRQMVGVDCRILIWQHGSLHCVTMQYPTGVLGKERPR